MTNKEWLKSLDTKELVNVLSKEPWISYVTNVCRLSDKTLEEALNMWLNCVHEEPKKEIAYTKREKQTIEILDYMLKSNIPSYLKVGMRYAFNILTEDDVREADYKTIFKNK